MKKNRKIYTSHSKKSTKKKEQSSSINTQGDILSMGKIDLTFKIEFSDKDLEIKTEDKQNPEEINENEEKKGENKKYYNIEDFKTIKDLEFLKDRKDVWDKFLLVPNNNTLEHLLSSNVLRKNNIITEYIGFGRPLFINNEKFFKEIFEYVTKRNNILFNKTPLSEQTKCKINFEFTHKKKMYHLKLKEIGKAQKRMKKKMKKK